MKTITARRMIGRVGAIEYPVLMVAPDGTIADLWSDPHALRDETSTLTATFLDLHFHGAVGEDVMTADAAGLARIQRFLPRHGVSRFLPTTVAADVDQTLRALEVLADAVEREPRPLEAVPVGIHLEGPFLSCAKRGVHRERCLQRPSVALFERFRDAACGHIRLMTIAPELEGAAELIAHATSLGVRCSMGHTNATAAEARAGVRAGAVSATHTFNAMRPIDHREPGVVAAVLDDTSLFAEMICDGVHTAPEIVRLWWRTKRGMRGGNGADARALLVTDAMSATGASEGRYTLAGLEVTVVDGRALLTDELAAGREVLAGSVLTLDRAVENLMEMAGASLCEAVRAASHTPADLLGEPDWTRLVKGSACNLNRYDNEGRRMETILRGETVPA